MPSTAILQLAAIPVLGTLAGVAFEFGALLSAPSLKITADACNLPSRQRLETDITQGRLPIVDNLFCTLVPIFKAAVATRLNAGLFALLVSVLVPLFFRLCYQAVSPNRRTNLYGGIPLFVITALGQLFGVGMVGSSLGSIIYSLAAYRSFKRTSSAVAPVPTTAGSIYISNLVNLTIGVIIGCQLFMDSGSKDWLHTQIAFQFFPLLFVPIIITSLTTPKINTERESRQELRLWDAESVSYSFERTWSNYRKIGGMSAALYWYGLNRIIRGVWFEGNKMDDVAKFFLFDLAGSMLWVMMMVMVEKMTLRTKAEKHPLTGLPRPQLDVECEKAIHQAPASWPWIEKSATGLFISALVAGPGFSAAMWWASGEEELGWKSRKAWRETKAEEGGKKKEK